ncbi:BTB/POZ domain-containing protein 7-like [Watersipora subatra]|uniref:BTB/POZ domain-containing protein 7-like n=1 Tax=Watersipora subatra TaxID=2589382 RepID=UPI00355AEB01
MGGTGSHVPPLPHLPSKIRKAAITQALGRKFDKHKRLSRTLKRIIHYNSKHPNKDQCKLFRELVSTWTTVELSRLVEVYESIITLHQVAAEAASARCLTHSGPTDLLSVLEKQVCTDLILRYQGACFPCHKAILASRSVYFQKLFAEQQDRTVDVPSSSCTVDSTIFLHFLYYLYSDCLPNSELISPGNFESLCNHFGVQRTCVEALAYLHHSCSYTDLSLVFLHINQPNNSGPAESVRLAQYSCHSAVLASRSELLCNLIVRRLDDTADSCCKTEIILDDSAVSHKYGQLLLHIIYQDELNLGLVNSQASAATASSLSEAQAIVAGRSNVTLLEETMELHHIGNFLELPILVEKCEDYIVQSLCPETLCAILSWSSESSGSKWVYRETLQYVQDNFMQISQSPALLSLDESTLAKVLQSDFLQASEFDVLQAIMNWSEHQLIRKLEKREPNLVTNTAHSLARKGIKAKDLDESQLREIAAPLLLHVRQSHILPSNPDVITNAVRRGLVNKCGMSPQRNMAASEPALNLHIPHRMRGAWVPSNKLSSARFEIPRGYMPFYDTARVLLEERTKDMSESDVVHLRRPSRPNPGLTLNRSRVLCHTTVQNMTRFQEELSQLPFEQHDEEEVVKRTQQLLQTRIVLQALRACWDKSAVLKQVCLWAVRELGYADQIIYTIDKRTTTPLQSDNLTPNILSSSLVPDLAPERLILEHGLSSSLEELTIHSVSSSPDVTLLSVRAYKEVVAIPFPDVTLHSQSSSENDSNSLGAVAKTRFKKIPSIRRLKKEAACLVSQSIHPATKPDSLLTDPPDVLEGSPPNSDSLTSPPSCRRQAATLDSRYRRSRKRNEDINPYYTPPRAFLGQRQRSISQPEQFCSLHRNINIDHLLASAGPPPDIAQQPARRTVGTSLPPDITASPNNTWQAML